MILMHCRINLCSPLPWHELGGNWIKKYGNNLAELPLSIFLGLYFNKIKESHKNCQAQWIRSIVLTFGKKVLF